MRPRRRYSTGTVSLIGIAAAVLGAVGGFGGGSKLYDWRIAALEDWKKEQMSRDADQDRELRAVVTTAGGWVEANAKMSLEVARMFNEISVRLTKIETKIEDRRP